MAAKKIALFIDADNVSAKFGKRIIDELEGRGELFMRRIYGNWEKISLHGWNDCILNFSLRAVQQPDFVTGKNATDMSLTIDAMDVLHSGAAEVFALVSNDSDFTPLVIRLREGGKTIIGLGNSNASGAFRAACSEFIDLDAANRAAQPQQLDKKFSHAHEKFSSVQMSLFDEEKISEPPPPAPPVTKNPKVISLDERKLQSECDKKIQQMHDILRESAKAHGDADGFSSINYARQDVRNKNLSFTVHDFGYGQLREFIIAYPKLYDTRQDETGRKFCYRWRENHSPALDDKLKKFHDALSEAVAVYAGSAGFANLASVDAYVTQKNLGFGVRDFGYLTLQKFLDAFPELYELHRDGDKAFLRCRVNEPPKIGADELQKFHDTLREAVEVHGDDAGFVDLCYAGQNIRDKNLGFGFKDFGYTSLQKFLAAFPNLYELRASDDKIFYRCRTNEPSKISAGKLQKFHDALREAVEVHGDGTGFANLCSVGSYVTQKNLGFGVKNFGHSTLQKFLDAFPELYELRRNGNKAFLRCRTNEPSKISAGKLQKFHDTLREAVGVHGDDAGFADLCAVGTYVNKKNLGFGVKDFGHLTLQKFLAAFPNLYELRASNYKVFLRCRVNEPPKISDDRIERLHDILRQTATTHADETGFADLSFAGNSLGKQKIGFGIRSLGYSTLQKFVENFPDRYEVRKSSAGTFYRCRVNDSQKISDADKLQRAASRL